MQIYTFTKDELAKILQRACQLFAQQDGVYDFLPGHFGRNIAVIDVLAEIDLAINTSRADPEHWLDEMIAANMALSIYVPDEEELDEILRTGEIPYVGQPITYKSDDDDYGLAPVA